MTRIVCFLIHFLISFTVLMSQGGVPKDWYYGEFGGKYNGIDVLKAYENILKNKTLSPVIVAVIDSGIDVEHEDLKDNLWVNQGELPGNGIDDDKNGYVDDVHGWNFIGGADGTNVGVDTYEAVRLYGTWKYKYENANPKILNKEQKKEYDQFLKAKEYVEKEREAAQAALTQIEAIEQKIAESLDALGVAMEGKEFNQENLDNLDVKGKFELMLAKNIATEYMQNFEVSSVQDLKDQILSEINAEKAESKNKLDFAFNPDFDPRKTIVKDNYKDVREKFYGNSDAKGPDALHGTHVAGIIGAVRNNKIGMDGVAPMVKLMSVRAVPDGDERDKDVANAIIYAVDNGASIINMSFGKGFSPDKKVVDEAVKYAAKKDVLLVHAAGNAGQDNDKEANFPNATFQEKSGFLFWKKHKKAKNWISVGALSPQKGENSPASFSNYGQKEVDIFAPGVQMYSTTPENEYQFLQGTSFAAPVVAGVAAALRAVFPALTAEQVKEAIMMSSAKINNTVNTPGGGGKINFAKLSVSGGVVNLEKALQYAGTMKGKKKINKVIKA